MISNYFSRITSANYFTFSFTGMILTPKMSRLSDKHFASLVLWKGNKYFLVTYCLLRHFKFFVLVIIDSHHLLKYVVKGNNFYYLYLLSINKPELKDVSNIVMSSSESRSNGRAIVVVVGPTAFVYICQNVFDLHFANLH